MTDTIHDTASAAKTSLRHPKTILRALRRGELLGYQRSPSSEWRIYDADLQRWIRGESPRKRQAA